MRTASRHLLLCTASCVLAAAAASAQTITSGVRAGIDFGTVPHAGQVVDQVAESGSVDVSAKTGLTGGGFVQIQIDDRFSFQPELLFVMKGVKLTQAGNAGTVTAGVTYLEFPLLARYTNFVTGDSRGYVVVGPTFALVAATKADLTGPDATRELDIDNAVGNRDIGLAFGGGLESGRYVIDLRYTLGLSDIASATYEHADSLRNRVLAITVGMTFR